MDSSEPGPINLGSDQGIKIIDVAKKIIELAGSKSTITFKAAPSYMAKQSLPDISLAKDKLGWFPLVSLEDGLKKTIEKMKISLQQVKPTI